MPRFVLLRHECPPSAKKPQYEKPSHWDFMLEWEGVLRTWELRELPATWALRLSETAKKSTVGAFPLPDHRLAYLDYEGPVSDGRGNVRCCDRGTYELLQETSEVISVRLSGDLLRGSICLTRQGSCWKLSQIEE